VAAKAPHHQLKLSKRIPGSIGHELAVGAFRQLVNACCAAIYLKLREGMHTRRPRRRRLRDSGIVSLAMSA
jgi:hypothetical protein